MPVTKKQSKENKKNAFSKDISFGNVSLTQKAVFAKHLSVMLAAGLLINEALAIAEDSAKGKLKYVVSDIRHRVESGNSLAESFAAHKKIFGGLFIDVTRAGERSGNLPENLENIAAQLEKEKNLVSKIKGAMAYPTVILIAAGLLALGMSYFVLPQITPLFAGLNVELPMTTRLVIAFSELVQSHGKELFVGILFSVFAFVWLIRQTFSHVVTHWVSLHVPIIKEISKNSNLARFSLTLGTLLRSGLTVDEALEITTGTVPNFYYRRALKKVAGRIEKGTYISENLADFRSLFPKLVTSMVHVGEESGKLDETLLYLASFYEEEVDSATKTLTTALEPMLLIGIGLVVGTLALSIITPIYEITGNIRR